MKSFLPFIIIAICIGAYYLYISPAYAEISTLSAKKSEFTDALNKSKEVKQRRDSLLVSYNAISPDDIARLKKIIPESENSALLAENINSIASQYGMVIRSVKIDVLQPQGRDGVVAVASGPYQTTTMSFTVKGTYDQFIKFLQDIESNTRLADVVSLSAKGDQKSSGIQTFQYTVQMHTYSLH